MGYMDFFQKEWNFSPAWLKKDQEHPHVSIRRKSLAISEKEEGPVDPKQVPWWSSCRLLMSFVGFFGFINLYALRVEISVAMVAMVNHTAVAELRQQDIENGRIKSMLSNSSNEYSIANYTVAGNGSVFDNGTFGDRIPCPGELTQKSSSDREGEFVWTKDIQGLILGAFFWGYMVSHVPGGFLAQRYGGKRVLGWAMFICMCATLLSPIAARTSYIFLIVLRVIIGLGQGVVWPSMHCLWAHWAPPLERGKLTGFCYAGAFLGNVVAFPLSGVLCEYGFDGGWPSVFYFFSILTFVWFIFWNIFVFDAPDQHPRINKLEKRYIMNSLCDQVTFGKHHEHTPTPWKAIATSKPCWGAFIAQFAGNWGAFAFLTNMPTYMKDVLKLDVKSNGLLSAIPYLLFWAFVVTSGQLSDLLRAKKILTTTGARKLFNTIGELVPAICIVILGHIDCHHPILAIVMLTLGVSTMGCQYGAGFVVNYIDFAPKYAPLLFGIGNGVGCIPGFVCPYLIGILTPDNTQEQWQVVFYIKGAILLVGTIAYLAFGSGELQDWAKHDHGEHSKDEEGQELNDVAAKGKDVGAENGGAGEPEKDQLLHLKGATEKDPAV
ncbi:unnamed protein product [Owenia fusiformis]|uniref:Uncharacterized protein n=1 Tax=Owenia fusiformis TaxID=6347 RepID=A0A8J1Y427_OWEFU|nr:unnamed protein product [Owenia fusiformis]